ncbi:MAG TPA: hypothetical protein VFP37_13910 [Steroidobacteraceae bacterium]|nr:hypothetical protein [Steroidobacteraceae bacterium]
MIINRGRRCHVQCRLNNFLIIAHEKLVCEILRLPSGSCLPQIYCVDSGGTVDRAVTDTLLSLLSELDDALLEQLDFIITAAEGGSYQSADPHSPDFGMNEMAVWITRP